VGKSYKKFVGNATYLKKEDLSESVDTVLLWIREEKVTAPGKDTQTRLVAYFEGLSKGLVLNTANCETLAEITGTDDYEKWADTPSSYTSIPTLNTAGRKPEGFAYVYRHQYGYRYKNKN
jgi:hypothetical protein